MTNKVILLGLLLAFAFPAIGMDSLEGKKSSQAKMSYLDGQLIYDPSAPEERAFSGEVINQFYNQVLQSITEIDEIKKEEYKSDIQYLFGIIRDYPTYVVIGRSHCIDKKSGKVDTTRPNFSLFYNAVLIKEMAQNGKNGKKIFDSSENFKNFLESKSENKGFIKEKNHFLENVNKYIEERRASMPVKPLSTCT